ncbi:sugar phosphate isomerase/epimerase [Bacillus sp. ISL-51]|uniref:sugar phosphate isomerase/epimerase family protein n=1 Tax=Bacteria TaxID=2 RepID=UPI001BE6CCC3|nr:MULTISPECIES: sugar phosphate isomerase/epimerase family protein [Bacteria]MBT2575654.1 sugar phosphate isomerase/epimerase [Bacillus sp. ISL-51]MBT2634605.1 sugar phosphate isomerase/epimerase [Bacillus sp. ISL-26]MBT2713944.1 sugar phosphate isomerase/epimerase [Pseudomonas sp. ISL-88]
MKLSFCTTGFKKQHILDVISFAREHSFDGIELWYGHAEQYVQHIGPLDRLHEQLQDKGLEVPAVSLYTDFVSSDERQTEQDVQRALSAARQLHSPLIRVFAGSLPSHRTSPEKWQSAVEQFQKAARLADDYEINIGLEIHYDTYADTPETALAFLKDVGHPRLRTIFDGSNLHVNHIDQMTALEKLFHTVSHVHLKSYHWNFDNWYVSKPTPVCQGDLDQEHFLKELRNRQYERFVSLEYFGDQAAAHIKESLQELEHYFDR